MNNEQQELVGDAYKSYENKYYKGEAFGYKKLNDLEYSPDLKLSQEEFINKCKIDPEFSEKWGLKIEEKELSTQERNEWFQIHLNGNNPFMKSDWKDFELDQQNIPTKQITLEYNNEKTYYYE
jgi:hypothetical protein